MRAFKPPPPPGQHCSSSYAASVFLLLVIVWPALALAKGPSDGSSSTKCYSLTQCYLAELGAPKSEGEWTTAYISALHEHCAGILQQGSPQDCKDSIRCMYIPSAAGSPAGDSSNMRLANFLYASNSTGGGDSGISSTSDMAFWKAVVKALQLRHGSCLPIPSSVGRLRTKACKGQEQAVNGGSAASSNAAAAPQQFAKLCDSNAAACLMRNVSSAADMSSWWTGQAPQDVLESDSRWAQGDRLQRAADTCTASWSARDARVGDACATRGVGKTPWNNSLTINQLVVALMDAYESSSCNNAVSYSEAMAVDRIIKDVCLASGGCQRTSAARAATASMSGLLPLVLAVTAWLASLLL